MAQNYHTFKLKVKRFTQSKTRTGASVFSPPTYSFAFSFQGLCGVWTCSFFAFSCGALLFKKKNYLSKIAYQCSLFFRSGHWNECGYILQRNSFVDGAWGLHLPLPFFFKAVICCRRRILFPFLFHPHWLWLQVFKNANNRGYGLAADIWSLGYTVLEMLTRVGQYSDFGLVCN